VLLSIIGLGLRLLPFETVRRLLGHVARGPQAVLGGGDQASIPRVTWAVAVASRYVPAVTCLIQALTTQVLLNRRGLAADLRIGVTRDHAGTFAAHAWVEYQGNIVIGGAAARSRYTALPPLDGGKP